MLLLKRFSLLLLLVLGYFAAAVVAAAPAIIPAPPEVAARGHLLADFHSGRILAEKNADERMEPASLTKIMASYVVMAEIKADRIKESDLVRISEKAWRMEGSRSFVPVGTSIPVEVLLKGMIVQSGNDATVALAEYVAGSEEVFASMMNQQAQALGMTATHFVNSTGLPHPDHYTTARDLFTLTRALIRDFPEHYRWYAIKEYTYNNITQHNRNTLLWQDKYVDGVKTGHTESAGYCLVASGERDGMRLISVVLGTGGENERARESQKLLTYGFRFYETRRLYTANEPLSQVRIWKGAQENLPLGLKDTLYLTLPRGQYEQLNAAMKIQNPLIAPARLGQQYGTLNISLNGETLLTRPLVALQGIAEGDFFQRVVDEIKLWLE